MIHRCSASGVIAVWSLGSSHAVASSTSNARGLVVGPAGERRAGRRRPRRVEEGDPMGVELVQRSSIVDSGGGEPRFSGIVGSMPPPRIAPNGTRAAWMRPVRRHRSRLRADICAASDSHGRVVRQLVCARARRSRRAGIVEAVWATAVQRERSGLRDATAGRTPRPASTLSEREARTRCRSPASTSSSSLRARPAGCWRARGTRVQIDALGGRRARGRSRRADAAGRSRSPSSTSHSPRAPGSPPPPTSAGSATSSLPPCLPTLEAEYCFPMRLDTRPWCDAAAGCSAAYA